jgi:hypothetical protein
MSTFKVLQDEVLAHGFAEGYRARTKVWLNQAQSRIARHVEIRELYTTSSYTTVAGTATYTLPTDFVRATGLQNTSQQYRLTYVDDPNLLREDNLLYQRGSPTSFSFSESGLLLSPIPGSVESLLLTYYKRPADLSADGDTSVLPADYHDLMVSWTLSRAYRSEDDAQMSQFYQAEYQRDLALLTTDRQFEETGPRQVAGTWGEEGGVWYAR